MKKRADYEQSDIFDLNQNKEHPLAFRLRPAEFKNFVGQEHLFTRYPFLSEKKFPAMILWGPPGTGKTTLAHLLAKRSEKELFTFSPVLGGVADLKKLIEKAMELVKLSQVESVIFIDEIHRFNKAQQDALLPYVERGDFTLIGATTEHPKTALNHALLSRMHLVELKELKEADILKIVHRAQEEICRSNPALALDGETQSMIAYMASGDARRALNALEVICKAQESGPVTLQRAKDLISENSRFFDKNEDRHYDVISAFIKSLRGSNPQSAILWLAVMLDGGEDPQFIARRLVIFAAEDIGNADPSALTLATSALTAVKNIGMPEARILLAQATTYLASTVKSNASYLAIDEALEFVRENPTLQVPAHLKSHPPPYGTQYKYPHDHPGSFVKQEYTTQKIPDFYRPSEHGREKNIKDRLADLWGKN